AIPPGPRSSTTGSSYSAGGRSSSTSMPCREGQAGTSSATVSGSTWSGSGPTVAWRNAWPRIRGGECSTAIRSPSCSNAPILIPIPFRFRLGPGPSSNKRPRAATVKATASSDEQAEEPRAPDDEGRRLGDRLNRVGDQLVTGLVGVDVEGRARRGD